MESLGSDVMQQMAKAKEAGAVKPVAKTSQSARPPVTASANGAGAAVGGADLKEALKAKEQALSKSLMDKQKKVFAEAGRLRMIEQELEELRRQEAEGINILRGQLEKIDKSLVWLDSDAKQKREAFDTADAALKEKLKEKDGVQKDLTKMIMSSEKKKESKLNELMLKMNMA